MEEAWAAVEAAIGDRSGFLSLMRSIPGKYTAHWRDPSQDEYDAEEEYVTGNPTERYGYGPTPTAALRALARNLENLPESPVGTPIGK